jgi:hypothetical protein
MYSIRQSRGLSRNFTRIQTFPNNFVLWDQKQLVCTNQAVPVNLNELLAEANY